MTVRQLVAQERSDLVGLLRTLSDEEWEVPSLCAGWRVRDVVAHVLYDAVSLPTYLAALARCRFSVDRLNAHYVDQAKDLPASALVSKLESTVGRGTIARLLPNASLADVMVHHQDIRRPLGRERTIDPERLLSVLNHPDPFARPWRWTRGLRFVATDVSWSKGDGPEVRGTGEALALATVGRSAVLDELDGDGVAVLRARLGMPISDR